MFCLIEFAAIAWVLGWIIFAMSASFSLFVGAGYIIFKIIEIIKKELE